MKRLIKRAAAQGDLDAQATFIGEDSPHAAIRFLEAADQACALLASMPELGSVWETDNPEFAGMRVWPIRGFEKHLLFYRSLAEGLEVIRVLHASRNIAAIFEKPPTTT